jgi:hypothetical protein
VDHQFRARHRCHNGRVHGVVEMRVQHQYGGERADAERGDARLDRCRIRLYHTATLGLSVHLHAAEVAVGQQRGFAVADQCGGGAHECHHHAFFAGCGRAVEFEGCRAVVGGK